MCDRSLDFVGLRDLYGFSGQDLTRLDGVFEEFDRCGLDTRRHLRATPSTEFRLEGRASSQSLPR